jgi:dTDP-4-amino-4,6-dideoxygalactose transaminase
MGEAGAITTGESAVAERCRVLRDHGQRERYVHVTSEGTNARLDALQAAVLSAKLRRLEEWNDARRRVAGWYQGHLAGLNLELPREKPWARSVYHLYVVVVDDRDRVRSSLESSGIQTGLHYPVPLHLQEAYASMGLAAGTFPASERVASAGLSLPLFPHMTEEQVVHVAAAVQVALRPNGREATATS